MPKNHELKSYPEAFQARLDGLKPYEYRLNDRDYQTGDTLTELEWHPEFKEFTGRVIYSKIIYILPGGQFGIPADYCILTLEKNGWTETYSQLITQISRDMQRIKSALESLDKYSVMNLGIIGYIKSALDDFYCLQELLKRK